MNQDRFPGGYLERRREELGLSVDDVYRKLRIPPSCVSAFEAGAVESLPVETYSVGFLTTYCEFLGLDPEPWLDALRECQLAVLREGKTTAKPDHEQRPKWVRDAIAWVAVSAILALGWLAYTVVVQPGPESGERVQAETRELEPPEMQVPDLPRVLP